MPLSKRAIARRAAAVLAGRVVPMTREQIHAVAEVRRQHICSAVHARHPFPGTLARMMVPPIRLSDLYVQLGTYYSVAAATIRSIHRKHCYRRAAIDVGCTCEPDKRDVACVHHGEKER